MPSSAYIAVFSAVLLPAVLYVAQSLRERRNINDIRDFFPLRRCITSGEYRSTTVAAGMSLATVIIAFINLAPMMGITLFVSVISYSISFLILYPCVGRIMAANPNNDSIQAFLGKAYGSPTVKYIALIFSLIGYISIFSMELLVGVTVLQPLLKGGVLAFALVYLLFIIAYSLISGYRAIIATDKWQLRFILISLASLIVFAMRQTAEAPGLEISSVLSQISSSWLPIWPFILGITVMNLPAPISDAGTWQRLCSTKDATTARRGLLQITPFFAVLWTILVLFGCYYGHVATAHGFDAQNDTLIAFVIKTMGSTGSFSTMLLFMFVLGLFSAMISTADSVLIVASQVFCIDIMKLNPEDTRTSVVMKKARVTMAVIAVVSFVVFTAFHVLRFDVVQLVFAIYGAQLAMFPAVCAALFLPKQFISRVKVAAGASILCGFVGGWTSALYGKFGGAPNWLYNAPVAALLSGILVFAVLSMLLLISRRSD